MPSTSSRVSPARASAASITASTLRTWWRDASSGTTPPYGPWTASCDDTTDDTSRPSRRTAAAVSSHELSRPRTTTSDPRLLHASARRLDREEDGVVAAPHEEQHALALARRAQCLRVCCRVLHRRAVDLEDHVAATHARVAGRSGRVDLRDHDTLHAPFEAEVLGQLGRERLHGQPQILAASTLPLRLLLLVFQLRDGDREVLLLLVTDHRQVDALAHGRAGDQQRQVRRVVDRLAVELN